VLTLLLIPQAVQFMPGNLGCRQAMCATSVTFLATAFASAQSETHAKEERQLAKERFIKGAANGRECATNAERGNENA